MKAISEKNKVVVKFKAIDYYTGNKKTFRHTYETEQLFVDTHGVLFGTKLPYTNTAKDKAETWVDGIDKMNLIHDKELMCILDYEVVYYTGMATKEKATKLSEQDKIVMRLKELNVSEKMATECAVAYSEMKDNYGFKKLYIDGKVSILMQVAVTGLKAHVTGMNRSLDILYGKVDIELKSGEDTAQKLK